MFSTNEPSVLCFIMLFASSSFSINTFPALEGLCLLVFDLVLIAFAGTAIFLDGYHMCDGI